MRGEGVRAEGGTVRLRGGGESVFSSTSLVMELFVIPLTEYQIPNMEFLTHFHFHYFMKISSSTKAAA